MNYCNRIPRSIAQGLVYVSLQLGYCLVKHFNNINQFLLKISLILWDKFSCNFKYIFINEIGFIKIYIYVIVMGKINKK